MADCLGLAPSPLATAEPSPLLQHLADGYAGEIAALWPAPHHDFLTASAARRHLICIWVASGGLGPPADLLLSLALRRLLTAVAPEAPPGVLRALAHIGEAAWSPGDYRLLFARLGDHHPAKVLRHATTITPEIVRRLSLLPAPLTATGLGGRDLDPQRAALLTDAFEAIRRRQGEAAALAAAARWGRARSLKQLMSLVREDLVPELPPAPFPGSKRLKLLGDKAAMIEAGRRLDNCLESQVWHASDGDYAFYEWVGPPAAAVELRRDPVFGWSLNQSRLAKNRNVPPALRQEIAAEVQGWGVHIGRDGWELSRALRGATQGGFTYEPLERIVERIFADEPD